MKVTVTPKINHFREGDIVALIDEPDQPFLVTCPCFGYEPLPEDSELFWAINLTGNRISGGNYLKSLFSKFSGSILIEC